MNNGKRLHTVLIILVLAVGFVSTASARKRRKKDAIGHQPMALENTFQLCQDGEDNDSDNYIDCDDQDCLLFTICSGSTPGTPDGSGRERFEARAEVTPTAEVSAEAEEVVDLDSLEEEPTPPPDASPQGGHGHGGMAMKPPKFKLFFDLLVEYRFEDNVFQFTRDHAHVMLELSAMDWLSFRADIAFEPEFYEAIFHLGSTAEFRIGKILVPFGQNEFHHLIGGRVDYDGLFLPTVWGDYGLAFKHFLYDGDVVSLNYSLWVTNGFQASTDHWNDPAPSRSDGSLSDNNQMKGVGLRPEMGIGRAVTIGTSWYVDAWDEENDNMMLIYGADIEFGYDLIPVPVLKNIRLRAEAAWAEIKLQKGRNAYNGIFAGEMSGILPSYGFKRSGYNIELSYRIVRWLFFRFREGRLNDDTRWKDEHDYLIHEPGLVATFGPVQLSLMGQLHTPLATVEDIRRANEKKYPPAQMPDPEEVKVHNESRLLLRMLFRY